MKRVPRVLLISIAALGLTGCRTFGTAPTPRTLAPPEPRTTFDVKEFVSEHNRNAELVESMEAKPQITASMGRQLTGTPLTGVLVMERPRNFKLELKSDRGISKSAVADIGSNGSEFWFWVKSPKDKSIYVCNYDDLPSTPLAVSFQPDWIVDALGLKPISPEEARGLKTRPGQDSKTTELVFPPMRSNGQSFTRIITVTNQTRRIKTHRLYGADKTTLLAQADISEYQEASLDETATKTRTAELLCLLPKQIRLDWKKEQFTLDVNLKDVTLNSFDPELRKVVFVEPVVEGYVRVNLATSRASGERAGDTTIRETMPPPDSKTTRGVRLGNPIPEPEDAASAIEPAGLATSLSDGRSSPNSGRSTRDLEEPLRPRFPQAPDPYDYQTANSTGGDFPPPY